jgi:hypothetical protein
MKTHGTVEVELYALIYYDVKTISVAARWKTG